MSSAIIYTATFSEEYTISCQDGHVRDIAQYM